ncbi:MAG: hypothetical protein QOI95_3100 [Acidimicrobiaceae bacterium]
MTGTATSFVAWLPSHLRVHNALDALDPEVRTRIRLRVETPSLCLLAMHGHSSVTVYADINSRTDLGALRGLIPIVSVTASPALLSIVGATHALLAVRVPADAFGDPADLQARIERVCEVVPNDVTLDLFVDIPSDRGPRVAEAIAIGAARRVPCPQRWREIYVSLRASANAPTTLGWELRSRGGQWSQRLPSGVSSAEAFPLPRRAYGYLLNDRWVVADAIHQGAGRLLVELIANHTDFPGPRCCAGDRWLLDAARGELDAENVRAWQDAALVHWMTTRSEALTERLDGEPRASQDRGW